MTPNSNQQSEQKINPNSFHEFCNHLSEIIIITNSDNKIVFTNNSFTRHFGFTFDQIKNKNIDILFLNKSDLDTDEKVIVSTMIDKKGVEFSCELKPAYDLAYYNNQKYKVYFILDLRKKIEQERELKEFEDKYQTLFYEIKDPIYESTPDGKLLDINPAGVEFFGYENKEELQKVSIANELYNNPYDRTKFKDQLEKDGYVKDYEIEIKKKNGPTAIVLETAFIVRDEDGNIKSYHGILRDITESKNYEEKLRRYINELGQVNNQLIQSEDELRNLNASKDKFFSIVAHDLRSPFTSLIGYSEFLKADLQDLSKDEISLFANNINESAKIVFNLLENLLQWSRVQTGRIKIDPEIYDFSHLVQASFNLLRNNAIKKEIELINNVPPRTLVYSDIQTISSVIQNIVSNAIKFTPKEGTIEVGCKIKNDTMEIFVKDSGVGIEQESINKLFRIDTQLSTIGTEKESGSGLGLILCKEFVEKNNGEIWVESEVGEGSTFYFTLPTQG